MSNSTNASATKRILDIWKEAFTEWEKFYSKIHVLFDMTHLSINNNLRRIEHEYSLSEKVFTHLYCPLTNIIVHPSLIVEESNEDHMNEKWNPETRQVLKEMKICIDQFQMLSYKIESIFDCYGGRLLQYISPETLMTRLDKLRQDMMNDLVQITDLIISSRSVQCRLEGAYYLGHLLYQQRGKADKDDLSVIYSHEVELLRPLY